MEREQGTPQSPTTTDPRGSPAPRRSGKAPACAQQVRARLAVATTKKSARCALPPPTCKLGVSMRPVVAMLPQYRRTAPSCDGGGRLDVGRLLRALASARAQPPEPPSSRGPCAASSALHKFIYAYTHRARRGAAYVRCFLLPLPRGGSTAGWFNAIANWHIWTCSHCRQPLPKAASLQLAHTRTAHALDNGPQVPMRDAAG